MVRMRRRSVRQSEGKMRLALFKCRYVDRGSSSNVFCLRHLPRNVKAVQVKEQLGRGWRIAAGVS